MKERVRALQVPAIVAGVLTSVYLATLAPGVTLWDAGEFQSAIRSLGIPHPPGTPLYV
ncbi:MAG: protein O-mannosyl-transferase family, partial [Gemmatimonadaceae bacterium]